MKQRLGIAQALLNDPKIIVLDEPTAGLDPKERVRFRNLIKNLGQNSIVLLSTHIVSDIEHIADTVLMMNSTCQTPKEKCHQQNTTSNPENFSVYDFSQLKFV